MKEIHLTRESLNRFTVFNKGGYEGKILIYSPKILLKEFEPFLASVMDLEGKQKKIMRLYEKNISENIMIKPQRIVYVDDKFSGYTMKKISDAVEIDSIRDYDLLLDLYIQLFSNLNTLHENEIIVGDLKPSNILVTKENKPIFIDVDSMGVDEFKIDNEDYRSKNTRTISNFEEIVKKTGRKNIDKLMLLACLVNSLNDEKRVTLSYKISNSDLSYKTKQNLIKILNDINSLSNENITEILQEEREQRKR